LIRNPIGPTWTFDMAHDCRAQEDLKLIDETFKPMMQSLAVEMPKACAK